jgi:hypothetical protein
MRYVFENIEAAKLSGEIERGGITPRQRLRVVVETMEASDLPLAKLAQEGGAFDFLADEPDVYTLSDVKRRRV